MEIKLENISKEYKNVKVLDNINLEIKSPAMIGFVDRAIDMTSLEEKRKFKIKTLSGGQKQRVGIAQAILNNFFILLYSVYWRFKKRLGKAYIP